ncbi:MAG: ParB/RepB/Spo0J family partition protein [Gammaproteobacteria bacterium]
MAKKSFKIKGNLAEALGDTVNSAKNNAGELHIEIIPLRRIELDPDNPRDLALSFEDLYHGISKTDSYGERKNTEKEALSSLAKSIKEQGIINPIVVYKHDDHYRLIAGERRTLASILAEKIDIPAKVLTTRPDPFKLSLLQWIENIEREDLTLWERLKNLEKILNAYANINKRNTVDISPTELSQLLGCSLQQGVNYRQILNASDELRKHIQSGEIKNIEKAALISKSPSKIQNMLIQACLNGSTLSELKKFARDIPPNIVRKDKHTTQTKVNFGQTGSLRVAKTIINTILEHENFQHLNHEFNNIHWDDHKSIAMAFRQLVKLLEQA